jgi:hypothetical protein
LGGARCLCDLRVALRSSRKAAADDVAAFLFAAVFR